MAPVFVSLPMDILDAPNEEQILPTSFLVTRSTPEPEQVIAASSMLAGAKRPMIIMGDGVATSEAQVELALVAETLGAEVWGADSSEVNISEKHPLYKGPLGHMFGDDSRRSVSQADAVLICGTYVFPEVFPALSGVFAPGARVVHIDLDSYEIAKNFPVDLGLVSDPKLTLGRLAQALQETMTPQQREEAKARTAQLARDKEQVLAAQLQGDQVVREEVPLHTSRFMEELAERLPKDALIFDEALTASPELVRYLPPTKPGHYFQTRGGSLGVGIPGAIGLKLAHPEKTVVGFTGDGGSMYTIQALWTAAHYNVGAKFVICNNQSYLLLKLNILQYWNERGIPEHEFPASFDLGNPVIKFDQLAQSMGVPAARVERPDQIGPAIRKALGHEGPFLIDLIITNQVPGSKIGCRCGQ
jgi:thiamine pyrophosphate-dependent acetolactate synthase large subunit-like protein